MNKRIKKINIEYKAQFQAKQSFKKYYSKKNFVSVDKLDSLFTNENNISYKYSRNTKLTEGYLGKIGKSLNIIHNYNYKNRSELQELFNNKIFFKGKLTGLCYIETRSDILICRLGWADNLKQAHSLIKSGQILYSTQLLPLNPTKQLSVGNVLVFNNPGPNVDYLKNLNTLNYVKLWVDNNNIYITLLRMPLESEILTYLNSYSLSSYSNLDSWINNFNNLVSGTKKLNLYLNKFI